MILVCSRGHRFDTTDIGHQVEWGSNRLRVGGRCPMEMSYDRMSGSTYCRRILHEPSKGNQRPKNSV